MGNGQRRSQAQRGPRRQQSQQAKPKEQRIREEAEKRRREEEGMKLAARQENIRQEADNLINLLAVEFILPKRTTPPTFNSEELTRKVVMNFLNEVYGKKVSPEELARNISYLYRKTTSRKCSFAPPDGTGAKWLEQTERFALFVTNFVVRECGTTFSQSLAPIDRADRSGEARILRGGATPYLPGDASPSGAARPLRGGAALYSPGPAGSWCEARRPPTKQPEAFSFWGANDNIQEDILKTVNLFTRNLASVDREKTLDTSIKAKGEFGDKVTGRLPPAATPDAGKGSDDRSDRMLSEVDAWFAGALKTLPDDSVLDFASAVQHGRGVSSLPAVGSDMTTPPATGTSAYPTDHARTDTSVTPPLHHGDGAGRPGHGMLTASDDEDHPPPCPYEQMDESSTGDMKVLDDPTPLSRT
jgi:hypothetical protein